MASRVTRRSVTSMVDKLRRMGLNVHMGRDATGWRMTDHTESIDLSPRLSTRDMVTWLEGYLAGFDRGHRPFTAPSLISAGPNAVTY